MKNHKLLVIFSRALAIAYILFLSLFALDVFQTKAVWYLLLGGFLIHLIPSFIMIAVLLLAWKWPQFGGALFIVVSLLFFIIFKNSFWGNVLFFGPLLVVGFLFLAQDSPPVEKSENV